MYYLSAMEENNCIIYCISQICFNVMRQQLVPIIEGFKVNEFVIHLMLFFISNFKPLFVPIEANFGSV